MTLGEYGSAAAEFLSGVVGDRGDGEAGKGLGEGKREQTNQITKERTIIMMTTTMMMTTMIRKITEIIIFEKVGDGDLRIAWIVDHYGSSFLVDETIKLCEVDFPILLG